MMLRRSGRSPVSRLVLAISLLLAALGLAAGPALPARAANTIPVSTCDESSLRNAISTSAPGDTISFGCSGTIGLGSTLAITKNLTLDGTGQAVILDGRAQVRVLDVGSGVSLTLNRLTIEHGNDTGGVGGAIYNGGTLNVTDSTLTNNTATGSGAGAIYNAGTLTLTRTTLSGNTAGSGGAVWNVRPGTMSVIDSTFSGNRATSATSGHGGALQNYNVATVTNSTFTGNSSAQGMVGGAIQNITEGTLSVSNSTFSGNSANQGGGISNFGNLAVTNATFNGNSAPNGGGAIRHGGGTTTVANTIMARLTGGNCIVISGGPITNGGGNLADDASCSGFTQVSNASLMLGLLANNGGPTQTIALGTGSLAINAGVSSVCNADPIKGKDQRGSPRGSTSCDSGAYDTNSLPPADITPPVITSVLTPGTPSGSNGWYTGNVGVDWTVTDAESAATVESGCVDQTIQTDTSASGQVLSCKARSAGGTDEKSVTILRDATAPVVAVTGVSNGATYTLGSVPAAGCTTTDSASGVATQATLSTSGGPVGSVTVTCGGALDRAGNAGSRSVTYSVQYRWTGFADPVNDPPTVNSVRAGGNVPVAFSLSGNQGLTAVKSVTSDVIACDSAAPVEAIKTTGAGGNSGLQYDASSDQYTSIWKTERVWAGTCRQLQVALADGTSHQASFKLVK